MSETSTLDPTPRSLPPAFVAEERRPQADPLPSKRGEIGYVEGIHSLARAQQRDSAEITSLPARHPADRDQPAAADGSTTPGSENPPTPSPPTSSPEDVPSSPTSMTKSSSILKFLKPKTVSFGGVQSTTLLIFSIQFIVFAGTIVAWVFLTKVFERIFSTGGNGANLSSTIFVHVVFVIVVIFQLIFLERRLFRLRGERYSYLHPGEILPRHRTMPSSPESAIAFAPWNRPPLPTYAATLAQSGVGTGDVEDHLIAAPPPPAYGNTRGSTLLLQGYLRASLRAQRPLSAQSQTPPQTADERPLSYVSRDDEWSDMENADRARRLEETLNRLEAPPASAGRR